MRCRAPYGARGLKFGVLLMVATCVMLSRPVWGAWIEIDCITEHRISREKGRAPYGARGLKLLSLFPHRQEWESRPVWGAWIEISNRRETRRRSHSRAPYGARGLKFLVPGLLYILLMSRPVWGAWIEI